MPDPRLTAVITALIMMGSGHGVNAAYNLSQLQIIEGYILTKNCGGLLGYLNQNPTIMEGDDPLAQELRAFANGVEGGIIECLSANAQTPASGQLTAGPAAIY